MSTSAPSDGASGDSPDGSTGRPDPLHDSDLPSGGGSASGAEADRSRSVLQRILPDLAPWRSSRDFRLLWLGRVVAVLGIHILSKVSTICQLSTLSSSTVFPSPGSLPSRPSPGDTSSHGHIKERLCGADLLSLPTSEWPSRSPHITASGIRA